MGNSISVFFVKGWRSFFCDLQVVWAFFRVFKALTVNIVEIRMNCLSYL
jgi:hypothetical protein